METSWSKAQNSVEKSAQAGESRTANDTAASVINDMTTPDCQYRQRTENRDRKDQSDSRHISLASENSANCSAHVGLPPIKRASLQQNYSA
jgi:hypothetical protein